MRLPTIPLSVLALAALSGCFSALDGEFNGSCPPTIQQAVDSTSLVYPAETTGDPLPAENPSLTIHALAGQKLTAQAVWQVSGGSIDVSFDGPTGNVSNVQGAWSSMTTVATEGDYTLTLAGAPFAYGVSYVMTLIAVGCPSG